MNTNTWGIIGNFRSLIISVEDIKNTIINEPSKKSLGRPISGKVVLFARTAEIQIVIMSKILRDDID